MKYSKMFRILVLALSLSLLLMVAMPAKPILAQSITLSKYSGYLGTEIIITGTGFDKYKYDKVHIFFGDTELKSVVVSETGTFTVNINVPSTATPGKSYSIAVKDILYRVITSKNFVVAKAILEISPVEGRINDWIRVEGRNFDANKNIIIYFSSDKSEIGQKIGSHVTVYEDMRQANHGIAVTDSNGNLSPFNFKVPETLSHGTNKKDVIEGEYYVYAAYYTGTKVLGNILAFAKFMVLGGEIKLDPEKGQVGTEVQITGVKLRNEQRIIIKYDGNIISVASGNSRTDSEGSFNCSIIIPECVAGNHVITVRDESGNMADANFRVVPTLTVHPTSEIAGNVVKVTGIGYGDKKYITITLEDKEIATTPEFVQVNRLGNFNANLIVPAGFSTGTYKIVAKDNAGNKAETQLTILVTPPSPASMNIEPKTSASSPGFVGMELAIDGARFSANTSVTITLSNGKPFTLAETMTDNDGNFSEAFTVPPIVAGIHTITASDGSNTLTSVFIMESEAPIMPAPLLPKVTSTAEEKTYFDWEDIDDTSGITYVLQIGADADFTNILLEKEGLLDSEYRLTEDEKLESTNKDIPYYWRVKAVDGASNDSEWTPPRLFYVGTSSTLIPAWLQYTLYVLGGLLIVSLGFWLRRRTTLS